MIYNETELFSRNTRVIHNAIARLHVHPATELYSELFGIGSETYINYLRHFEDPLETTAQIERFNRIAGNIIYKILLRTVQRSQRNQAKFNCADLDNLVANGLEPARTDDYSLLDFDVNNFYTVLHPTDLKILYLHAAGKTNKEISLTMQLAEATISRRIRRMRAQLISMIHGGDDNGQ